MVSLPSRRTTSADRLSIAQQAAGSCNSCGFLVSLAGPTANLLLAVLLLTLTRLLFDPEHWVLWAGVAFLGFLQIMAVVLNLLPIPVLDGGHLLFYAGEAIYGKPIPRRAQEIGARVGRRRQSTGS